MIVDTEKGAAGSGRARKSCAPGGKLVALGAPQEPGLCSGEEPQDHKRSLQAAKK